MDLDKTSRNFGNFLKSKIQPRIIDESYDQKLGYCL